MRVVLLVLLTGCGRLAFDAGTDSGTAPDDSNAFGDALADAVGTGTDAPTGVVTLEFGEQSTCDVRNVTTDTVLSSIFITANYGAIEYLDIAGTDTPLLRFDLSFLPTTAMVQEATLEVVTDLDATSGTVSVHPLLEDWDEGTGTGTTGTANYTQRKPGQMWAAGGAQGGARGPSIGSFQPGGTSSIWPLAIPAATVQGWVTNPATNFGMLLDLSNTDSARFHSSESASDGTQPLLRIRYSL